MAAGKVLCRVCVSAHCMAAVTGRRIEIVVESLGFVTEPHRVVAEQRTVAVPGLGHGIGLVPQHCMGSGQQYCRRWPPPAAAVASLAEQCS